MTLEVVTPPASEPVSLESAKLFLRLAADETPSSHPEDSLITAWIKSARGQVERYTGRRLVTQTLRLTLDSFPDDILLPVSPVQEIVSVTYVDGDGTTQTLAADQYFLDDASSPPWLVRAAGSEWPTVEEVANAVRVTFVAGYDADVSPPEEIPQEYVAAMLALIGRSYAYREGGGPEVDVILAEHLGDMHTPVFA